MKQFFISFALLFFCVYSFAQTPSPEEIKKLEQRVSSICPEVAKLAEAIALTRSLGYNIEWTTNIIYDSVVPTSNEAQLIYELIHYVYQHPEFTPYEHLKNTTPACYEAFGVTPP